MKTYNLRAWACATAAVAALSACGGSDEYNPPPVAEDPTMVPASASASAMAFSTYVASVSVTESGDPLNISGLVPPTSETDDPVAVTR